MNLPFDYTITKKSGAKNLRIKIDSSGKVQVTAPWFVPEFLVHEFVKKNQAWIIQQTQKREATPQFNSKTHVHIFGKLYEKKLIFSTTQKVGMYTSNNQLLFNPTTEPILTTENDKELWHNKFEKKLEQFLKNTASHYIIARTHALKETMQLSFNKITLKKQKTRWGSCSSKKNLNFNWQLVYFEPNIIDYVIIHELAHLVHMNHSKQFWNLVARFDPDYKKHVQWLQKNGLNLS